MYGSILYIERIERVEDILLEELKCVRVSLSWVDPMQFTGRFHLKSKTVFVIYEWCPCRLQRGRPHGLNTLPYPRIKRHDVPHLLEQM